MSSNKVIKVGSRKSKLALIQTYGVIDKLKKIFPDYKFEVVGMATVGDKIQNCALSQIGETSLFTKELEECLLNKDVDFLVHSLKDLPTLLPDGLVIGCVLERDDPYDAVVMHPKHKGKTLDTLPAGSVIGTSSLRRIAHIKRKYPQFVTKDIRGNLNARFNKLDNDDVYDAMILAVAGLERMDWTDRMSEKLSDEGDMYAVSQGAVGVECHGDDNQILTMLSAIHDIETAMRCAAERSFVKTLEGGGTAPVAVHSEVANNKMFIGGAVFSVDGSEVVEDKCSCELPVDGIQIATDVPPVFASIFVHSLADRKAFSAVEKLGVTLAQMLLKQGAKDILDEAKNVIEKERAIKKARKANAAVTTIA